MFVPTEYDIEIEEQIYDYNIDDYLNQFDDYLEASMYVIERIVGNDLHKLNNVIVMLTEIAKQANLKLHENKRNQATYKL